MHLLLVVSASRVATGWPLAVDNIQDRWWAELLLSSRAGQPQLTGPQDDENWSTFEVIGHQELRVDEKGREQIIPVNGFFTEAVIQCAGAIVRHFDNPKESQAVWLLIDELNRAHLDKAFGELFTVLGTTEPVPVTLQYQRVGNRDLLTPRRFRIIATLNSIDRQFVNSLSQGLKRRFSFITLDIPDPKASDEPWGNDASDASSASREFRIVIEQAAERVARRAALANGREADVEQKALVELLLNPARDAMVGLFAMAEKALGSLISTADSQNGPSIRYRL